VSTRINKAIGYGLTDLQFANTTLTDARINQDSPLVRMELVPTVEGLTKYVEWVAEHSCSIENVDGDPVVGNSDFHAIRKRLTGKAESSRLGELERCFIYNADYGLGNVIVLRPWTCPDWHRRDDMIDAVSDTYVDGSPGAYVSHVSTLRSGLYPFAGYMHRETGECLPHEVFPWMRADYAYTHGDSSMTVRKLNLLSEAVGFADYDDAKDKIVPAVPDEIRDLAAYWQLFTDEHVWKQLRPLLYTYWS
jgi:hypothetical protein